MADRVQELVETVLKRHLSNITTLVVMEWSSRGLREPTRVDADELVAYLASVRCSAGFFLNDRAVEGLWRDIEALDLEELEEGTWSGTKGPQNQAAISYSSWQGAAMRSRRRTSKK